MSSSPYLESVNIAIPEVVVGKILNVKITWKLGARAPSFLELYDAFNSGSAPTSPNKLATGINPKALSYSIPIDVSSAPIYIFLAVAPRTGSTDNPNADMPDADGVEQNWYDFQTSTTSTLSYQGSGGTTKDLTPPLVTITTSYGKTFGRDPFFVIQCSSGGPDVDDYQLDPTWADTPLEQQESKNGYFTQIAAAAGPYQFSAQSNNMQSDMSHLWSTFSKPINIESPPNYRSVMQFIQTSIALGAPGLTSNNIDVSALLRKQSPPTLRGLLGF